MQGHPKNVASSLLIFTVFTAVCFCFILPNAIRIYSEAQLTEDPAEAHKLGQTITTYELPEGYIEEGAAVLLGTTSVFIVPEDRTGLAIVLMKFDAEDDDETVMMRQTEELFAQQRGSSDIAMTFVREEETFINSRPITLKHMEGTDNDDNKVLQVMAAFPAVGGKGTGLIMIRALEKEWDEAAYTHFIESVRE